MADTSFNIEQHIQQIERRLQVEGRACVLVGAGFSRSAIPSRPDMPPPPTWWDFGQKLGERLGLDQETIKKKTATRIPDEFEVAHGRDVLEQAIQELISDDDYSPSSFHHRLMRLPWVDVFTTNYDTLLERAADDVVERRYSRVCTISDLTTTRQPRIVKLHGSFPGHRPFISTDEDFRTYPRRFAPFVNLVQQSLIENTLVLIGFSGEDPNFQAWSGWVRDELGHHAPRIYLVTLDIDHASKRYLEKKHVNVVDLAQIVPPTPGTTKDAYFQKAYDWFLSRLEKKGREKSPLDWPFEFDDRHKDLVGTDWEPRPTVYDLFNSHNLGDAKSWQAHLERWDSIQKRYPGWIVCPGEPRRKILSGLDMWFSQFRTWSQSIRKLSEQKPTHHELHLAQLLTWWVDQSATFMPDEVFHWAAESLARYAPFGEPIKGTFHPSTHSGTDWDWVKLSYLWLEVAFGLLRSARMYNDSNWFERISSELIAPTRQNGFSHRLQYELIQMALSRFQLDKVKEYLVGWPIQWSDPFWAVRKAGILAELGEARQALELSLQALREIRTRTQQTGIDYRRLSEEGWCIYQIQILRQAVNTDRILPKLESIKNDQTKSDFLSANLENQEISPKRLRQLSQYWCDPLQTIEYARGDLPDKIVLDIRQSEYRLDDFDPNRANRSMQFSNSDWLKASQAWIFVELFLKGGIPFQTMRLTNEGETYERVLRNLWGTFPAETLLHAIRSERKTFIKQHLTRIDVLALSETVCNELISTLLTAFQSAVAGLQKTCEDGAPGATIDDRIVSSGLEVLSRFTIRMTPTQLRQLFDSVIELAKIPRVQRYNFFHNYLEHGLSRILFSWSREQIQEVLHVLLEWPMPIGTHLFPEPFQISPLGQWTNWQFKKELSGLVIADLLSKVMSLSAKDRWRPIVRLGFLYQTNALSKEVQKQLGKLLWASVPNNQLPQVAHLYQTTYLSLPAPPKIDVKERLKYNLLNRAIPPICDVNGGYVLGKGDTETYFDELRSAFHPDLVLQRPDWSNAELLRLFQSLTLFWANTQTQLSDDRSETELLRKLTAIATTTFDYLLPLGTKDITLRRTAKKLVKEVSNCPIQITHVRPTILLFNPREQKKIAQELEENLKAPETKRITSGAYGVVRWLRLTASTDEMPSCPEHLLQLLIQSLTVSNGFELETSWDAIKQFPEVFSSLNNDLRNQLELILDRLRVYTRIYPKDSIDRPPSIGVAWAERPVLRARASQVAAKMWLEFNKQGKQVSKELSDWRDEALKDVLPEVRHPWTGQTQSFDDD
jgi:hypothetical protein